MEEEKKDAKKDEVEEVGILLEKLTNVYGCRENLKKLALRMTRMHRTLVQSFAGAFVIPFVRELAKQKRTGCYDERNIAVCEACEAMCEGLEQKYGITENDPLNFCCI